MKRERLYMVVCMLAAFVLSSCEHKDLCYHHPHTATVRVEFDWRDASEAHPEGMCVFFYSMERGGYRRFDFADIKGGPVELEVGTYRVIFHNNDSEVDLYRGTDDFDMYESYTREAYIFEPIYGNTSGIAPASIEDETVCLSPDILYGGHALEVEVSESGVSYTCVSKTGEREIREKDSELVITLYPEKKTCTYTYEIRNVKNLKYTTQMSGSLSGLCHGIFLGNDAFEHTLVTVPFEAHPDGGSTVTGRFCTYGHCRSHDPHTTFTLYVWMKDGAKYYYTWDVTDQVDNAPDPHNVHIIIDGLAFPQPIDNGSGFDVAVDDWQVVEEDIIM